MTARRISPASVQKVLLMDTSGDPYNAAGGSGAVSVVGGAVADDAAASGNPVPVGGIYNSTPPTYTNLDRTQFQFESRGSLRAAMVASPAAGADGMSNSIGFPFFSTAASGGVLLAGAQFVFNGTTWDRQRGDTGGAYSITVGDSYTRITTATTTVVKASAGTIKKIIVNSLGTVASTVSVQDNATVIALIDTLSTTGRAGTYEYNVLAATNITIVTTGTLAPDVTVTWR